MKKRDFQVPFKLETAITINLYQIGMIHKLKILLEHNLYKLENGDKCLLSQT